MRKKSLNLLIEFKVGCLVSKKPTYGDKAKHLLMYKLLFILSIFLFFPFQGFSQTKYEKEFRISVNEVPSAALSFVDSIPFDTRVKWFKEIGLEDISIEAKARLKRERYSIEFCEKGIFQDVEIEIKPGKIPYSTFSRISEILTLRHNRYKFTRVQSQFTGDRNRVLEFLLDGRSNSEGIKVNYEIVISTRVDGIFLMLEYLFTETGEYVESKQIISRRIDTIDY